MNYQKQLKPEDRLLCLQDVMSMTGLTRSRVYDLMNRELFPRPIKVSLHRVAWIESEVRDYLNKCIAKRNMQLGLGKVSGQGGNDE